MKVFNEVDFEEWKEIADKCEYATFFHTPTWSKVFAETYPEMEITTKKFVFNDETKAILPLIKVKTVKGLFNNYLSNVAGTYGGWISNKNLSNKQINIIIQWINKNLKNLVWRINPFDSSLRAIPLPRVKSDFTQYLDLKNGFDSIYKLWTKGHASATRKARKAHKEGVTIKESGLWKEWKQYFEIYEDSIRRWGNTVSSRYSVNLFKTFFKEYNPNIKLWLAYFEGKPIAGALCFYHNHHVVYWHGAALEKHFSKRPSNLLQYEIIKDACKKNYWWYDFNPSGGHKGVINFKKSFGAKKMWSNVIYKKSLFCKLIEYGYRYAGKIKQKL